MPCALYSSHLVVYNSPPALRRHDEMARIVVIISFGHQIACCQLSVMGGHAVRFPTGAQQSSVSMRFADI